MDTIQKSYRFAWRLLVNALCTSTIGRRLFFPTKQLSSRFGRGDAEYAWLVFLRHYRQLHQHGFEGANRVLEVGPGRNLGTSLLWWCYLCARSHAKVEIVCWDVFKNAAPEIAGFWQVLASELLNAKPLDTERSFEEPLPFLLEKLSCIAGGDEAFISYHVMPLHELIQRGGIFDLIYSQAAIEHIWFVERFWEDIARLTQAGGWHSHRIDLADHGRRETNYVEFLQWSEREYWITQRFVPGALNRWRASDHLQKLTELGFTVLQAKRDLRDALPISRQSLSSLFRSRDEVDLRTTAIDLVASL